MHLLEVIRFILKVHDEAGLDYQRMGGLLLKTYGVTLPWGLVRDIIDTLHQQPPSGQNGPIHGVEWAMHGFEIIVRNSPTVEMSEDISDQLKQLNYDWDEEFVSQVILAQRSMKG